MTSLTNARPRRPTTGGGQPLYVSESGSSGASTKSAISNGGITITNKVGQKQDVATLNRDTSNLNGTVSKTPDLQQVVGFDQRGAGGGGDDCEADWELRR
ncbi:hypothetical protein [Burkholderia sp. LA-2-3-30-S1-D2]|uniref:hypothetical protein n=1 Tax=Burkholderia sp. LA-2-3-30-S1-D2 TaxID=1637862 RepID=UPI0015D23DC1|nr:hypothetical protein [Burkholderia sp. LA-2-3-30-S1-D2]